MKYYHLLKSSPTTFEGSLCEVCYFLFHVRYPGDRWCDGFSEGTRDSLLGKKYSQRHCYHFHVGVGKD